MSVTHAGQATSIQPADLGLAIPELLLPAESVDLYHWAVIACDQHTSSPDFWQETEQIVGQEPSALHLILPELYLEHPGSLPVSQRIARINQNMERSLRNGTLQALPAGVMLVDRQTPLHDSRKGLLLAVDLEHYDYRPGSREWIRASEGTVLSRIPPRLAVRKEAPLELPHIQLLYADPEQQVLAPLFDALVRRELEPCYQTPLMQNGGSVRGWLITKEDPLLSQLLQSLAALETFQNQQLLFAVGDGNHSLATAKAHWEQIRGQSASDHPARYALVEIINIFDPGIAFEPIHRILFEQDAVALADSARQFFSARRPEVRIQSRQASLELPSCQPGRNSFSLVSKDRIWSVNLSRPAHPLSVGAVQDWLDALVKENDLRLDYIHGLDTAAALADQGHTAILLPELEKKDFFQTIIQEGVLPRKTFSIGAAFEKRYYLECRKIR